MIPRIIHRIWLGANAMPAEHVLYGETWRDNHPGWEMKLWGDDDLPSLELGPTVERGRHYAERANVLRYELLRRFGGVYVDTDVESLRSIEPLLEGISAFAGYVRPGTVGNSVLGAIPGHPAFERASREASTRVGTGKNSISATGPRFLTGVLQEFPEVKLFEPAFFYPYDWHEKRPPASELGQAYAAHHWAMTGREESLDASADSDYLRRQVLALRRRRAKADRRTEKALGKATAARQRADRRDERLRAIEGSLWWRLHPGRLLDAARGRRRR